MPLRLNLGCGVHHLPTDDGWLNCDADPTLAPDRVLTVPPLPWPDGSVAEVYLGHFLEHFDWEAGQGLLRECLRVLEPGGRLGVVVPDTRAILAAWLEGSSVTVEIPGGQHWRMADLDDVCRVFLYSTIQPSRHQWSYCSDTLARALTTAGLQVTGAINRYTDPRLSNDGEWYQMGLDGVKPDA